MPELLWRYLTALLYYRTSGSCVAFAEALETVSHDRLTRMLQGDWSGQTLLNSPCAHCSSGARGIPFSMIRSFRSPLRRQWRVSRGSFEPGTQTRYGFSLVAGLDQWNAAHPARHTALAQRGIVKVCAGVGVIKLCPQPPTLPPGIRAL